MLIMTVLKGDKVRSSRDGPTMEVLAASPTWAICEWMDDGERRADLFQVNQLEKLVTQQAQQPQPPQQPPEDS